MYPNCDFYWSENEPSGNLAARRDLGLVGAAKVFSFFLSPQQQLSTDLPVGATEASTRHA
jgi:hypothetical protein